MISLADEAGDMCMAARCAQTGHGRDVLLVLNGRPLQRETPSIPLDVPEQHRRRATVVNPPGDRTHFRVPIHFAVDSLHSRYSSRISR